MAAGEVLLSRLISTIAVDMGRSESNLRQHRQQLNEANQASIQLGQGTRQMGQQAVDMRAEIIRLNDVLSDYHKRLRQLNDAKPTLDPSVFRASSQVIREQMAGIQGQVKGLRSDLAELESGGKENFNGLAQGVGKFYTALIAVQAGIKIIEDTAKAYGDVNQSLLRTEALTNTTHAQIQAFTPALRNLAVETGRPLKELAEGLYNVQSTARDGTDRFEILATAARASAVGMGQATDVTRILTQSQQLYGLTLKETVSLMDPLTVAIREGSAEAQDFARNIGTVLPEARQAGVSFNEVAAALAVMSLGENNAARNATGLRQLLQELRNPSDGARQALHGIGLEADQLRQHLDERGLGATLKLLNDRTNGNVDALSKIFPDIRAFSGEVRLLTGNGEEYATTLKKVSTETGVFNNAITITGTGVVHQSERMQRGFDNLGSSMAEKIAPIVTPLAEGIANGLTPAVAESGSAAATATPKYEGFAGVLERIGRELAQHPGRGTPLEGLGAAFSGAEKGLGDLDKFVQANKKRSEEVRQEWIKVREVQARALGVQGPLQAEVGNEAGLGHQRVAEAEANWRQWNEAQQKGADESVSIIDNFGERQEAVYAAAFEAGRQRQLIGAAGADLLKSIDEYIKKPFEAGGRQALEQAADLQSKIQEAWIKGLDPSVAEAQIESLTTAFRAIREAATKEDADAARTALAGLLTGFGIEEEGRKQAQIEQRLANEERARKRQEAADREREAKEARERMVGALTDDLEGRRAEITSAYGRVGDAAVSGFVSGLSGARSGRTDSIVQAQARLAQQLREAGVPEWQAAANRVGQAYLDALAGTISGQQAAQVLAQAVAEIPKLNAATLVRGLDRQAYLELGGNAGRGLAEGMADGINEGGQKAITAVQQNAIKLLRETEKINDPELAFQRSEEFWNEVVKATTDGSADALAALEEYTAAFNRQLQLDQAQQQYIDNTTKAWEQRGQVIAEAGVEASRQIGEVVRGVGEDRGAEGLESFRQHMKEALGETSRLFQEVDSQITEQQQALGGAEGFRAARENFQRMMDERLDAFREQQYKEQTIFQEGEESKRRELQHTRETEDTNRRHSREDAQQVLTRSREAQDVARRIQREESEAARQTAREIAEATKRGATPEEIAGIQTKAGESRTERERQRQYESEDRGIARARAQEDLTLRRGQEEADRQLARGREGQDVQIARETRQRQHAFELKSAQDLRDEQKKIAIEVRNFEDLQADQRHGKALRNIEAEREKRIREADETYTKLEQKEFEHLQRVDQQVNRPAWRLMLQGYDEEFITPAGRLLDNLVPESVRRLLPEIATAPQATAVTQAESAKTQVATWAIPPPPSTEPQHVVVDNPDDIAGAAADRPIEMDGEDVETVQSKIRRDRNRARSI